MRTAVLVAALFAVSLAVARAEDPNQLAGTEPVSTDLLKGRALWLEAGNCTVEAPWGFEWLASPGMTQKHPEVRMFLCRDQKQSQIFMVQIYDKGFAVLDAKGMDDFLSGARGSMEQQGWQFKGIKTEPARMPVPDSSYKFAVKLLRQDGQTIYWIGYVATAQKMYCLSSMQLEDGERPEFNNFVKSFKLIQQVSSKPPTPPLFPYIILAVVVGSVVVVIQTKRQKAEKDADAKFAEATAKAAGEKGAAEDDDDDETDAFKPKPIVPDKLKAKAAAKPPKGKTETRRDVERPRTRPDEKSDRERRERERDRPRDDEDSRGRREREREREKRRSPDEKSDRDRRPKNDRPFG